MLEIGPGSSSILLSLKEKGCEVFGVEVNAKSARLGHELGLNVFCGVLEEAHYPDNFFDTVIMSQVLEHLASPKQTLYEIFRILRPKGNLLIYVPNCGSSLAKLFGKYWHGWHIPFHFYHFTQETIVRYAEITGFEVSRISTVTHEGFFTVSLKSLLWGEGQGGIRPIDRGAILDTYAYRIGISPFLRVLDIILRGKGDCLKVELSKP